jgi:hypothetical protein
MKNFNSFFENNTKNTLIQQNDKEPDKNDVLILDDIDDFSEQYVNLVDIKSNIFV